MKKARALLLGTAGSLMLATTAMAADIPTPVAPPPPPAPMAPPAFSWSGPYIGAFAGYDTTLTGVIDGVQFGYNFEFGNFLAGLEVETIYPTFGGTIVDARLNARVGAVLGDVLLIYGEAGIGSWVVAPVWTIGGGIEYAIGQSISLFAEGEAVFVMGGGYVATQITAGVNYHAGARSMAPGGAFDFTGLYFGALAGWSTTFSLAEAGVQFGYNFGFGGAGIAGLEVETTHPFAGGALINASLNARVGYALGERFLAYAEAGIGEWLFAPVYTLGGGVEVGLGAAASVFAEAKAEGVLGTGFTGVQLRGGVNMFVGR